LARKWGTKTIPRTENNRQLCKAIGYALSDLRKKRGISQEQLAESASLDRSYMSGLERGQHDLTFKVVWRLCPVLRVTPKKLIATVDRIYNELEASER